MRLSVVLTVVDGGETLPRCLDALAVQIDPPEMEILVPVDATIPERDDWAKRYPDVRFLDAGELPTADAWDSASGQHELFDRRRAVGLAAAKGELIAILEDRGLPRPNWAAAMSRAHEVDRAVVGGPVDNMRARFVNWAVYFCDFTRYQPPIVEGPAEWATDVNICYARRAIEATRELWTERYHETTVHWALQRAGEELYLHPEPVVDQDRGVLTLGAALSERFAWGRLFAYTRAREMDGKARLIRTLVSPILPFVLVVRHGRAQWGKRMRFDTYLAASPIVFALCALWSLGEMAGYITQKP